LAKGEDIQYSSEEWCDNLPPHSALKELKSVERKDHDTNIYNNIDNGDEIPKGFLVNMSARFRKLESG
jgi:hypothetical protein